MKLKDIEKSRNKNLYLLFLSVLVGLTAGFLTSLYRLALEKAENLGLGIYSFTSSHLIFIPLLILGLVLLALLSAYLFAAETRLWAEAEAKELSEKAGLDPDAGPRSVYVDPGAQSAFAFVSYGHRTLSALSQAGLVEKFADALVWGFFPLFLAGQGLNLKEIGWIVGTYGLMWGVNQLWTGYLSDSWGRKWLIFAGLLFCAFGVAIFPRLEGVVMWSLAAAITGFGMALLYPTLIKFGAAIE